MAISTAHNMQTTSTIAQHLSSRRSRIKEAITMALSRNGGKSALIAVPLAQASRAANDFAADRFSILTARQVMSSNPEQMRGKGLIVYYAPPFLHEEEDEYFLSCLQAYRDTTILLFLLLTENTLAPKPSLVKDAWATGVFTGGEIYEISTTWQQVTLSCLKPLGPLSWGWWRKKPLQSWSEPFACFRNA